jgi:hypothetical protein
MGIVGYSRFRCRINGFNVYKMRNNNHQQGHYQNGNRQDNRKMEIVNVWNENQRGECESSKMGIIKMKIVYGMWKM